MALVAYDYDSGSDNDADDDSATAVIIPNNEKSSQHNSEASNQTSSESSSIGHLLSDLPKTKVNDNKPPEESQIEDFIPKYKPAKEKRTEKVKITIPSLSEFADDDDGEPIHKKAKPSSTKGSGLLSLLPPVKGSPLSTKSFVPHVVKNNTSVEKQKKSNVLLPNVIRKKAELAKMSVLNKINKTVSDGESDDDTEVPETFDEEMWKKVCGRQSVKESITKVEEVAAVSPAINIAPEPDKPYDGLDNAAFKELVGKSKKPVNIKLIDINEEEILPDKDLWLTKSLTDPDQVPKPAIENPVDPTRKKKHHITYLAEQAKANEQEFKSQWAASKYTRNQTRAKYGF